MDRNDLIQYVRARRLAVVATTSADGSPQAAVVGVAATGAGDLVFDTTRGSRKFANLSRQPRVALVIGVDWGDVQTLQLEGVAVEIAKDDPAVAAYFEQFPDGRERAEWPDIVYVRVRPAWGRHSDYRSGSSEVREVSLS
ncbi:pyridoxamine 5'-phosphate oxidase family protein [Streptomyces sp. NPDC048419]|uniref:pyridoxamine 5'-phosphate oxidase family protein n=1 Tax=Streptomyces sp. NPDC048419 TaxID=3365547 RepID=UPI00370FC7C0